MANKRGRPPGSRNNEYADLLVIPEACPKCKSIGLVRLEGSKNVVRAIEGVHNGFHYRKITWTRKRCPNAECGQLVMVRTFIPAKADEPSQPPPAPTVTRPAVEKVTPPPVVTTLLKLPPELPTSQQSGGPAQAAKN